MLYMLDGMDVSNCFGGIGEKHDICLFERYCQSEFSIDVQC